MKKINLDLRKLKKHNRGSSWQKAMVISLLITTILITISYLYLAIRPISKDVKIIIDEEISAVNINLDQKIIEGIKERQKPAEIKSSTTGKNPFAGF